MDMIINVKNKLQNIGFFHVFGSDIINKIVLAMGNILIVRIVSKEAFGVYTYANNILSLVLIWSGLGMTSAALLVLSEIHESTMFNRLYNYSVKVGIGFNILLTIVMLGMGIFVEFPIYKAKMLLIGMSCIPLFSIVLDLQRIYLRAKLLNKEFALLNNIVTITQVLCMCILALVIREWGFILAQYISYTVTIIVIQKRNKIKYILKRDIGLKNQKKEILKLGLISALNNGLSQIMYLLDIFVLGVLCKSETVVATYKVATTIPTTLIFIPTAIITCVFPYFGKNRTDRKWTCKNFKFLLLGVGAFNFCCSLFCIIFANQIIFLFFGKNYNDAIHIFRILCIYYFFNGTFRCTAGNLLATQRKLGISMIESIISATLNLCLNVYFIRNFSGIGAAYATLFTGIVSSAICTTYYVYFIHSQKFAEGI